MRILVVNHCHPDRPHICGQRAARFAEALGRAGHKVVLLTETLDRSPQAPGPDEVCDDLIRFTKAKGGGVYPLACPPENAPQLEALRKGLMPAMQRKALIAWQYIVHGSLFTDWGTGSRPYWPVVAEAFKPEVCWGIFGNTEAWNIAKGVARLSACPWVMDIKDPWSTFIPGPLQWGLARRFCGAAAVTAFSEAHNADVETFWRRKADVIYSGVPERFVKSSPVKPDPKHFRLTLVGSTYHPDNVQVFARAFGKFMSGLKVKEQAKVIFSYLGADHEIVRDAMAAQLGRCKMDIRQWAPLDEMMDLLRGSQINAYLSNPQGLFHHKVFEFLAAGRPIMVYPWESDEVMELAKEVKGRIQVCADEEALTEALTKAWTSREKTAKTVRLKSIAAYTWDAQAKALLKTFKKVCGK